MKRQFKVSLVAIALLFSFIPFSSFAQADLVQFDNQDQQLLYQNIIKELRCLVCQNQNLADSNAELAKDLRRKTFEMINQGKQYDEIIQYMVERYGEFVLYRPRINSTTFLLWFTPFVALIGLLVFMIIKIKKSRQASTIKFSDEEKKKVESLLENSRSQ